jgi:hypothetical protein
VDDLNLQPQNKKQKTKKKEIKKNSTVFSLTFFSFSNSIRTAQIKSSRYLQFFNPLALLNN